MTLGPARTAFVLGGARNLGAMQVGMLRALLDRGVVPDLVVGCSSGALNGAALAADPTAAGLDRLERLWGSVRPGALWPTRRTLVALQLLRSGPAVGRPACELRRAGGALRLRGCLPPHRA
jgi:NTE family protein